MTQASSLNTPMMRQYTAIKESYTEEILFFRLGDFYEMFLDDAIRASRELDLTLTGRGKDANRIPMCGIPYHAADGYIARLIDKGYKVAICEQVEEATEGKGITKREVVKVITPGTVMGQESLEATQHNYLASVYPHKSGYGLSFVDCSTGEFYTCDLPTIGEVERILAHINPKEVLIEYESALSLPYGTITSVPMLDPQRSTQELCGFFKVSSLGSFGLGDISYGISAAWSIVAYLQQTQRHALPQLVKCQPYLYQDILQIDGTSLKNLELLSNMQTQDKKGSLLWVLDETKTAVGGRRLKSLLSRPLTQAEPILARYDAVEELMADLLSREEIREVLNQIYDIERLISRVVSGHNNPRDCIALKESLETCLELGPILTHFSSPLMSDHAEFFTACTQPGHPIHSVVQTIATTLVDTPPITLRDGQVIREGHDADLDALKASFKDIKDWISTLEEKERERTGIKSLKVGFNKVFGYYFQISNAYKGDIPENYIRKQTLTNGERYISPELKEKETILLHGEEKQVTLELSIYQRFVASLVPHIDMLQALSTRLGDLDCLQSFASVSQKNNYCRPTLSDQPWTLNLVESRHPVLEKKAEGIVVSNSISFSDMERFMLITGPNMAGKSTIMRQIAITVVMAQVGCFVPAKSAEISLVDRLFTRIGALDNLYSGQSTFMVEMVESATILHNATPNSLILLDEIGRGTATYDGMSIAGAICEFIHNKIGARTCFATHYHELTSLDQDLPGLFNMNMGIQERDSQLVFTFALLKGAADKSYGIQVAKMAGLPQDVIQRASHLLETFEANQVPKEHQHQMRLF